MTHAQGEYFVKRSGEEVTSLLSLLDREAANLKYTDGEHNIIEFCARTLRRNLAFLLEASIIGGDPVKAVADERERCALIAEHPAHIDDMLEWAKLSPATAALRTAQAIAAKIREEPKW